MTQAEERQQAAEIDVEGRQERLDAMLKGDAGQSNDTPAQWALRTAGTIMGKCPDCGLNAFFRGRNRLSDCGHMRRSHGKLIPADLKPPKPTPAAPAGALTRDQALNIQARIASLLALQQRQMKVAAELDRINSALELEGKEHNAYLDSITAK